MSGVTAEQLGDGRDQAERGQIHAGDHQRAGLCQQTDDPHLQDQ